MKQTIYILIIIVLSCAISSCTNLSRTGKELFDPSQAEIRKAENLIEAGNYQEAANIFWTLAESKPSPQKEALQIRAAEAVLRPNTKSQAQQYLNAIDENDLNEDLLVRKRVATAELALLNGQPQKALDAAPSMLVDISQKYKPHVLAVRAKALKASGYNRESIETRLALNSYLSKPEQLEKNNQLIWQTLQNTTPQQLSDWSANNPNSDFTAWIALASIQKQPQQNLSALQNEIHQWRMNHPNHSVPESIINSMTENYANIQIAPNKIAVLLPLSGRYRKVAEAVYAGITTAREFDQEFSPPPELVVYDTGDDPIAAISYYRRAVNEGADFVIGPFPKQAVSILVNQEEATVPTLSLNYASSTLAGTQNLFQFGLLPEDEARQVAERASLDNFKTALVLVPEGEWGTRLLNAFTERFGELGGSVLQSERYFVENSDYSVAIKNLLQLNRSEQRYKNVRAVIQKNVEFVPRRRQDVDFIFIAASPQQARLLRPQLSFHYATDLPVYSTSHIFSGNENISADQDINGITYCDMPWLLSNEPFLELLRDSVDLNSSEGSSLLPRLAALGIDAYLIIPHLQRLATNEFERYDGTTGKLSVGSQNRIYRELIWAKFVKGRPQIIETFVTLPAQANNQ